jgi:hypothetical protein
VRLDLAQPSWLLLFLAAIVATSMACERWIEIPARAALLRRAAFARKASPTSARRLSVDR